MRELSRVVWLALLVAVSASGCIDRRRLNSGCDWTGDSAGPLDLGRRSDRHHLVADAQLAEGLAVRYADTEHRRRFGYGGHGGLIEHRRVLHECMDRFVDTPPIAVAIVVAVAAAAFSFLGVQLGDVWTAVWETVRIGDGHFGTFRTAHAPWGQHLGALFLAGLALFVAAAVVGWRLDSRSEIG